MELIDVGAIIVAFIAAFGAWAAQRSAVKASRINTTISSRIDAEKGAYERARIFDVETIERQNKEISYLRKDNKNLLKEIMWVKRRLLRIEHISPEIERLLREQEHEFNHKK